MSNTAISTTEKKRDIRDLIQSESTKEQLAMVLPKHLTADRMARVACTAVLKTPKLMECRPESLLQALMLCSQAGLEPDGRNAHLIPYGDQVQVIFDYKGLVALAERNGVESIYADKVCENDIFEAWVEEGEKKLKHKVDWRKPRGNPYAYYASCRRNNRLDYEVMTKDEVDAIRKRSRASGSGPWVTDYDEMGKKTVLRRMSKRWDLTPEIADVIYADSDTPDLRKQAGQVFTSPKPLLSAAPAADPLGGGEDYTAAKPTETPPPAAAAPEATAESPQQEIARTMSSSGVSFDDFRDFISLKGFIKAADKDSLGSYDELPLKVAEKIKASTLALAECIKKFGNLQHQPAA